MKGNSKIIDALNVLLANELAAMDQYFIHSRMYHDWGLHKLFERINAFYKGDLRGRTFALWGLAFKPNTDDMRDAPSLTIVPALVGAGARVMGVDPQGRHEGEALLPGVKWVENPYQAAQGAHLVVILTEWNEFRALDLTKLARKMETPRMADLRNIYGREDALAAGFEQYEGVGR